jgi:hypothetical protein
LEQVRARALAIVSQLHRRLAASYSPHCATNSQSSWGNLPTASARAFEDDFETAMFELWNQEPPDRSRLIIDMAIYFSRFLPASDGSDLYGELLRTLVVRKLLRRTAFATLNYECIFDIAAGRLGRPVAYLSP